MVEVSTHVDNSSNKNEIFEAWDLTASKHYTALGLTASNWAYFEAVIDDWNLKLADIRPHLGECFTAQIVGSERKLNAFISIVKLLQLKSLSANMLETFTKEASSLAEQRNRVVHDSWDISNPNEPKRLEVAAGKTLRITTGPVSTDIITKLADDIATLRTEFEAMASQAMKEMRESSPDK